MQTIVNNPLFIPLAVTIAVIAIFSFNAGRHASQFAGFSVQWYGKALSNPFVMEALSVVIQVASFRWRGKRVFRCAPIHHHFEMVARDNIKAAGRDVHVVETLVTTRLWILSILFAILGVASLKIR